jgi:hypothetical protein
MAGDKGVEDSSAAASHPSGNPAPVFISYASQDAAVANSIVESLDAQGLKCWISVEQTRLRDATYRERWRSG